MYKLEIKQDSFIQQTQYFIPVEIDFSRLLENIETFEMDKYYKLFPDLVEKIH
jgi:hypothetical protein